MKLHILTLALDAVRFLPAQLYTLNRMHSLDWTWHIVEGVALPMGDTSWCKTIAPRLSIDGTTELLREFKRHPCIRVYQQAAWPGKTAMCNTALATINEPCILLQMDADEFWQHDQFLKLMFLFRTNKALSAAEFPCRYFVGLNIFTMTPHAYGNRRGEWRRAWRYTPGLTFDSHEPPRLSGPVYDVMESDTSRRHGFVFDHYAYVYEAQVRFKEEYYGYKDALLYWRRLQDNKSWPTRLSGWLPWVKDHAEAELLNE